MSLLETFSDIENWQLQNINERVLYFFSDYIFGLQKKKKKKKKEKKKEKEKMK